MPASQDPPTAVLFVADPATAGPARAAVRAACDELGIPGERVEEVDVFREPRRALSAGALATPSLMVPGASGPVWLIGDFGSAHEVRKVLAPLAEG
jgi:hypothetical protein